MGKPTTIGISLLLFGALFPSSAVADAPECFSSLAPVSIEGTDGDDHLVGTEGDDVIDAGKGDDVIEGLDGNDLICGDEGADTIDGGDGDDSIRPGLGDDSVEGGSGADWVFFEGWQSWESGPPAITANLTRGFARGQGADTLAGIENMRGTAKSDRLIGDDATNEIIGRDDADFIDGKLGDDIIRAGFGTDTVYAGGGNDHVTAGPNRRRDGTVKHVHLGDGDDILVSSMQSVDDGGPGHDLLSYMNFEFRLQPVGVLVRMTQGRSAGGEYRATVTGFEDVEGSLGPDRIYGDANDNVLSGLDEDDYLDGRGGTNTLDGGMGLSDDCFNYETQVNCE